MPITDSDIWLYNEGSHFSLYNKLGAQLTPSGCSFAVWAPHAAQVSVIGDFNGWNQKGHPLALRKDDSGIWEGEIPEAVKGSKYKYYIVSKHGNYRMDKCDPLAFYCEQPPGNASIVWDLEYSWNDSSWIQNRDKTKGLDAPMLIYEVHLSSWRRVQEDKNRPYTYLELAESLPSYVKEQGFTHVEFLPVMEHPFHGSWGYQILGYFAPSSRYGTPQEFMRLIDSLHQAGIGVILDWVPSHFPSDSHGLSFFDGTYLYEYKDPKKRTIAEWNTLVFDYSSPQVNSFLISNALFWLDKYHADGIRVDAVASMLYLDYSRKAGEWTPNIHGGNENLEAIDFLRKLNLEIFGKYPSVQTIAEESTAWPSVTRPAYMGGLGFGMKWNLGWMHDTLFYMSLDPINRKHHQKVLSWTIFYAFSENFILPLSHDEVVYGKRSLLNKMPGDMWQKFANLRLLYGYMYSQPGKKLLFMGDEFGQWSEWYHEASLDWHLLKFPLHRQLHNWVRDLNHFYKSNRAFYELDFSPDGFEWIDTHDWEQSIISYLRKSKDNEEIILAVCNFTPITRLNYRVGVPNSGFWKEALNSDSELYGGTNAGNLNGVHSNAISAQGRDHSISITLPPLAVIYFKLS